MMNDDFTVKWEKQKWKFKVASPLVPLINTTVTYHGKVEKVFFLVKWNRHNDTYTVQWDDLIHTGSAWFHRTIAEAIQTIMADRAGFTMYERWRKNYPTAKSSAPTNLSAMHGYMWCATRTIHAGGTRPPVHHVTMRAG
jgi:hypothetical protein